MSGSQPQIVFNHLNTAECILAYCFDVDMFADWHMCDSNMIVFLHAGDDFNCAVEAGKTAKYLSEVQLERKHSPFVEGVIKYASVALGIEDPTEDVTLESAQNFISGCEEQEERPLFELLDHILFMYDGWMLVDDMVKLGKTSKHLFKKFADGLIEAKLRHCVYNDSVRVGDHLMNILYMNTFEFTQEIIAACKDIITKNNESCDQREVVEQQVKMGLLDESVLKDTSRERLHGVVLYRHSSKDQKGIYVVNTWFANPDHAAAVKGLFKTYEVRGDGSEFCVAASPKEMKSLARFI